MNEKELRELDAWIAEHVMGHKMTVFDDRPAVCVGVSACFKGEPLDVCKDVPSYSTDRAAAMQVLERCAENGILNGEFKLPVSIFRRGDLKWVVSQNFEDEELESERNCIVVEADTLPLAICLFAKELFGKSPV